MPSPTGQWSPGNPGGPPARLPLRSDVARDTRMRGAYLAGVVLFIAQAIAGVLVACAEEPATSAKSSAASPSSPDPVVALIREKNANSDLRKGANADDLGALEAFYRRRTGAPLWMTDMGFSAKGQQALFEIEKADDWGLDASAFSAPPSRRTACEFRGGSYRRDQARSCHSEIRPLRPRRAAQPVRSQRLVRSDASIARSKRDLDRDYRGRRDRCLSSLAPSQA